jgi:DNA-binding MarR family transcriptional regulator
MKRDFTHRFSFLVNDVAKLYSEHFDTLARAQIGLSRAQCRLLGVLSMHDDAQPLSQAELAQRMGLSAMGVATLCDRMENAGWIRREASAQDRRINRIQLQPSAEKALDQALVISDQVQASGLAALTEEERTQLVTLLGKARAGLMAWQLAPQADADMRAETEGAAP